MVTAWIYGAGMLLGVLFVYWGLLFLARDDQDESPGEFLVLLFFSLPTGVIGGTIAVWLIRAVLRLIRIVSMRLGIGWGAGSRRLIVSPVCLNCGRHATNDERVVSGLCPGCREPLFS
jgi:hypothetical protein